MANLYNCGYCENGYTWVPYSETQCVRIDTTAATPPVSTVSLASSTNAAYTSVGTLFHSSNYILNGTSPSYDATSTTQPVWRNTGAGNGPMNRSGIWASGFFPTDTWLGFSACLEITETKTYYLGIGADNNFRFVLDGVEQVNTVGGPYDFSTCSCNLAFIYWHVYPITIAAGLHTVELYGLDNGGVAASFGCEIYDNTLSELTGASTVSDINIIFSSSAFTEATVVQNLSGEYQSNGYSCPSGYVYSVCDGNCVQYTFCDASPYCEVSEYCVSNSGIPSIDNNYSFISIYNGFSFYSTIDGQYFIYYSNDTLSWCLSSSLGGECILQGKSPCLSKCPDLCDSLLSENFCPTPTPTPTQGCDSFNFEAMFDCAISPTPSQTPTITPTITLTPTPTTTSLCPVGIDASIMTITPTPSITPTMTPTISSPIERNCGFIGDVTFNTVDSVIQCQSSKRFQNCYNGFDFYTTNVFTQPNGSPISQFMIFQAQVNGELTCISFVEDSLTTIGVDNITLLTNVIGYSNLGDCQYCISVLTRTPTPTPSITPTIPLTPSITPTKGLVATQTPTPTLPSQWYLYRRCSHTPAEYVLQFGPSIADNVGEVLKWVPGASSPYQNTCWELISTYSTQPSLPPTWNVTIQNYNYLSPVVNGIYTCDTCVSGGLPVSNTPTPTPTPTKSPTPTPTPTQTGSNCYQLLVAISLSPCAVCNSTLEYTDIIYCSTPTLGAGSIVYLNSSCTTPITGGKLIQESVGGTVYQTNGNGSLVVYSCAGLDCGGTTGGGTGGGTGGSTGGGTGGGTGGSTSCYPHVVYLSTDECSLCNAQFNTNILTVYSPSTTLTSGSIVYYQSNCSSPIPSNYYLRDVTNGNVFDIGSNGLLTLDSCVNCPPPSQCGCRAVKSSFGLSTTAYYTDCDGNSVSLSVGSEYSCICYQIGTPITGAVIDMECQGGSGASGQGIVLNNCLSNITCS
jgi:hypothetical protein